MSVTSLTCQCHDHIIIMTPVQSVDKTLAVMSLCFACLLFVVQMFIASETDSSEPAHRLHQEQEPKPAHRQTF